MNHLGQAPPSPARIATYCFPPASKVTGGALSPALVSNDHNSLRLSESNATKVLIDHHL